jgi:hypothetical protein
MVTAPTSPGPITRAPERAELTGRDQIADFFASVPAGGRVELIELVVVRANGRPALATYLPDDRGDCRRLRDYGPRPPISVSRGRAIAAAGTSRCRWPPFPRS